MKQLMKNFLMIGTGISLTALLVLHTGSIRAGEEEGSPIFSGESALLKERSAQIPVATQGMRVYRDPQTGQLGPLPAGVVPPGLTISEQRMLSRSDQGLKSRTLPSGGVAIDLQGRYRNMSVATVGSDGQATVNCAITPAEAAAVLQAGKQSATGPMD
jgi:hypothetical protein